MSVNVIDNTAAVLKAIEEAKNRGLEKCGLVAERYAKENLKANHSVVTGNLRNSITHKRVGNDEYVGTNVEYAPYVELGTGIYAEGGSGAKNIPWVYQDENGDWHRTSGQAPKPYLRPAAHDHADEYKEIIKEGAVKKVTKCTKWAAKATHFVIAKLPRGLASRRVRRLVAAGAPAGALQRATALARLLASRNHSPVTI